MFVTRRASTSSTKFYQFIWCHIPGKRIVHSELRSHNIIIIIIIIIINCKCFVTRWQWLFYMHTKYEAGYY